MCGVGTTACEAEGRLLTSLAMVQAPNKVVEVTCDSPGHTQGGVRESAGWRLLRGRGGCFKAGNMISFMGWHSRLVTGQAVRGVCKEAA